MVTGYNTSPNADACADIVFLEKADPATPIDAVYSICRPYVLTVSVPIGRLYGLNSCREHRTSRTLRRVGIGMGCYSPFQCTTVVVPENTCRVLVQ